MEEAQNESEIFAFSSMPSFHPSPILIHPVLDLGREVWSKRRNYKLKAHLWSRGRSGGKGFGSDKTRWNRLSQPRSMLLWPLGVSSYFGSLHPSLSFVSLPGWYCWNSNPTAASFLLKILLRFLLPSGKAQTSLQHIQSCKTPITVLIAQHACAARAPHNPNALCLQDVLDSSLLTNRLSCSSLLCLWTQAVSSAWDSLPPSHPLSLSCLANSSPSFFAVKIASSPGNNPSHSPLSGIQSLLLFSHFPWLIVFIYLHLCLPERLSTTWGPRS